MQFKLLLVKSQPFAIMPFFLFYCWCCKCVHYSIHYVCSCCWHGCVPSASWSLSSGVDKSYPPECFYTRWGFLLGLFFFFVICYSTMEDEFIAFLLFYFHLLLMKMHLMWLLGLSSASVSIMEGKTKACQPEDKPQQLHGKQNPSLTSRKEQTNQGQLSTQAAQKLFSYTCKHAHLHRQIFAKPYHTTI